jgi:hypothetical protein
MPCGTRTRSGNTSWPICGKIRFRSSPFRNGIMCMRQHPSCCSCRGAQGPRRLARAQRLAARSGGSRPGQRRARRPDHGTFTRGKRRQSIRLRLRSRQHERSPATAASREPGYDNLAHRRNGNRQDVAGEANPSSVAPAWRAFPGSRLRSAVPELDREPDVWACERSVHWRRPRPAGHVGRGRAGNFAPGRDQRLALGAADQTAASCRCGFSSPSVRASASRCRRG